MLFKSRMIHFSEKTLSKVICSILLKDSISSPVSSLAVAVSFRKFFLFKILINPLFIVLISLDKLPAIKIKVTIINTPASVLDI